MFTLRLNIPEYSWSYTESTNYFQDTDIFSYMDTNYNTANFLNYSQIEFCEYDTELFKLTA